MSPILLYIGIIMLSPFICYFLVFNTAINKEVNSFGDGQVNVPYWETVGAALRLIA